MIQKEPPSLREPIKLLDAYLLTEASLGYRIAIMREIVRLVTLLEEKEKGAPWIVMEYHLPSLVQPDPVTQLTVIEPEIIAA